MNTFKSLAIILSALAVSQSAYAFDIVDTGTPDQTTGSVLNSGQWLAEEITTNQNLNIGSIEAYITDNGDTSQIGNTFTITVYDNNTATNLPLLNSVEFYQQATFNGDGWNGVTGLNQSLSAGTYWVAFEVGSNGNSGDTFQGVLPSFSSLANPLANAWYDGVSTAGYVASASSFDFGLGVASAVPLPSSLLLFASGLFALGRFGKRKLA